MARRLGLTLVLLLFTVLPATGQDGSPTAPLGTNLRDLIPNFLVEGITLARPETGLGHAAHFIGSESAQLQGVRGLNQDIGQQLSAFPLSSSAGGFTYEFDPTLGVFQRSTSSFGPVYAERHQTVGRGRFNLGLNFSQSTFDEIDDLNLRDGDLRLVFTHEDTNADGSQLQNPFEGDLVTTDLFLKIQTQLTAFVATFGVTDGFDVGVAVPLVNVDIEAVANARVRRLSTGEDSPVHAFENGTDEDIIRQSGSATGLGDVVVRGKVHLSEGQGGGWAFLADVRMPTGEERDLLGTGEWQLKGQLIGSRQGQAFSPHINAGFAVATGDQPNELVHAAGFDWAANEKATLAVDLLGRVLLDSNTVEVTNETFQFNTNPDPDDTPTIEEAMFPQVGITESSTRYILQGAVGLKMNVVGNLLVSVNGLVALSNDGLQDWFTPLVGMDYSF